jgi:hypothetical protein
MKKYIYICSFCFFLYSCKSNNKVQAGIYKNFKNFSTIHININHTYKFENSDTIFEGKWIINEPNEIGFKNWAIKKEAALDYRFAIISGKKIIFDLDNENNNYIYIP